MKVVFFHDHRIVNYKNKNYSNGSFSDEVFNRYTNVFGHITFYSRNVLLDKMEKKLSQIINEKVDFIGIKDFSNFLNYKTRYKFNYQIETSDAIIVRLPSVLGLLAARKAKQKCKPYLIELVGCPWDALWNHSWKGKLVAPFMWYSTKKAVKNAPYVLYVSSNFLQKRYPNNFNNISCSDVDLQPVKQDVLDQRLEKIKNMNKNKPLVLCTIANVDVKYKRQDLVIKAISELNIQGYNFEYRLVGGGNTTHLQSIAEKYGVADKVIFEGSVPHEKVFDYLDDIDIYIQPSDAESHGRVILEAMSRGCPCIGSSTGGIPELIDASFIFERRNVNELIDILASFDREKMIKQAKRNFEFAKRFDKNLLDDKRNEFLLSFKKYADQDLQGENK